MSSKKYASPLRVELKPSIVLFAIMAALHVLAVALIWKLSLSEFWQWSLSSLVLVSLYFQSMHHGLRLSNRAVVALEWDEDDQWILQLRGGERLPAQLSRDSFVQSALLILNFKVDGQWLRRSVVIPCKNGSCQPFRQLRVRLKLTGQRREPELA